MRIDDWRSRRAMRILGAADQDGAVLRPRPDDPGSPFRASDVAALVPDERGVATATSALATVTVDPDGRPALLPRDGLGRAEVRALAALDRRIDALDRAERAVADGPSTDGKGCMDLVMAMTPDATGSFAALVVTKADLRAMAGVADGPAPDPARVADLAALTPAVAQPVWRDGAWTGARAYGPDGARMLLEGFGRGKYRHVMLDQDMVMDLGLAVGTRGEGVFSRLAATQSVRIAEVEAHAATKPRVAEGPSR